MACTRSESKIASERAFSWWGYSGICVFGVGVWLLAADVPVWVRAADSHGKPRR